MELFLLESVLNRDQRTTRNPTRNIDNNHVPHDISYCHFCTCNRYYCDATRAKQLTSAKNVLCQMVGLKRRTSFWKNDHLRKSIRKLKNALLVVTFLIVLTFPSSSSAPTSRMSENEERFRRLEERFRNTPEYWQLEQPMSGTATDGAGFQVPNLMPLRVQLENAVGVTVNLSNLYNDSDLGKGLSNTKGEIMKYLPRIPGLPTGSNAEKVRYLLVNLYNDMEVYAVFFEQVLWDLEDNYGVNRDEFEHNKNQVNLILTEVREPVVLAQLQDDVQKVTRDAMPMKYRVLDKSATDVRNYYVFKKYVEYLKTTVEALNDLSQK